LVKNRLEDRVAELEQMLAVEHGNAQSMNEALEREVELRLQVEKQVLVLQQRFHDSKEDSRISSSCSSHSRVDQSLYLDAKTVELQKEVASLKESDSLQRLRAQKAVQRLKDVENELKDLAARNNNLKAENGELRQTIAKLRKELQGAREAVDGSTDSELSSLQRVKRSLDLKCVAQAIVLFIYVTLITLCIIKKLSCFKEEELSEFMDKLADLQDTNSSLVRQNRMLEGRSRDIDHYNASFEASSGHYKRDLRKALALLRDTQRVLLRERENSSNQSIISQLQEQLMDAEAAKLSALRGRHSLESELAEIKAQLEAALTAKNAAEDKALVLFKEKSSALALVEEQDEQMQNLLKKYKGAVQQSAVDSIKIADQFEQMSDMEKEKEKLREQLNDVSSALEYHQQHSVEKHKLQLAEQRIRDLEAKVELEASQKLRFEVMISEVPVQCEQLHRKAFSLGRLDSNGAREVRNGKAGTDNRAEVFWETPRRAAEGADG
uniref:GRIP domain-containing protein n=1 Tax=Gongylonema pulchrum TaxID=637853 RepID=A0A183E496_9BILA